MVGGAGKALGKVRGKVPEVRVELFQIAVLAGDDLGEKRVEFSERIQVAEPKFRLAFVGVLPSAKTVGGRVEGGVHGLFGVGLLGDIVVDHRPGKGHEGVNRISHAANVPVEALLVAERLQARAGEHHGLGAPADLVAGLGVEMLHHDFRLLGIPGAERRHFPGRIFRHPI